MKKKTPTLIIFICSALALVISLKVFWSVGVYVDDYAVYPYASPQAVYGGNFWLYMAWLRLALLAVATLVSGVRLFRK